MDDAKKAIRDFMTVLLFLAAVSSPVSLPLGIWVIQSALESRAYNHITGADTTTWEAMWTELRVQGEPRKEAQQ